MISQAHSMLSAWLMQMALTLGLLMLCRYVSREYGGARYFLSEMPALIQMVKLVQVAAPATPSPSQLQQGQQHRRHQQQQQQQQEQENVSQLAGGVLLTAAREFAGDRDHRGQFMRAVFDNGLHAALLGQLRAGFRAGTGSCQVAACLVGSMAGWQGIDACLWRTAPDGEVQQGRARGAVAAGKLPPLYAALVDMLLELPPLLRQALQADSSTARGSDGGTITTKSNSSTAGGSAASSSNNSSSESSSNGRAAGSNRRAAALLELLLLGSWAVSELLKGGDRRVQVGNLTKLIVMSFFTCTVSP